MTTDGANGATQNDKKKDVDIDTALKIYYNRFFPAQPLYQWLSYGNVNKNYFPYREITFTFKGDIYSRYNSFSDCESFRKNIISNCPIKIDIGAVYNAPPRNKQSITSFVPQEKELVFDVGIKQDMDAFDEVRTCCSGAEICNKCWPFMTVFMKVTDHILREDFGFSHTLWIYSGRRGVHCWVCDERARKLSSDGRKAIIEYISVIQGEKGKSRKTSLTLVLHPTLKWALTQVLEPIFPQLVLENQQMMATPERRDKILAFVPPEEQAVLREKFNADGDSTSAASKWADLKKTVEASKKGKNKYSNPVNDIIFNFTFPRLDVGVSNDIGHLLKAPFCVHPSTGRVCVPIDPDHVEEFDPKDVPTVSDLINDVDAFVGNSDTTKGLKDYKKTRLAPYIAYFKKQFLKPLQSDIRVSQLKQESQNGSKMEF